MAFERVPQEFMKNIFLSPHHFNDPENPTHGQYVHEQLRNDLYNDIVSKLVNCEFSILGTSEETMAIKRIEECRGNDPYLGLASKLKSYDGMESELICCEDWYVGLGKQKRQTKENKYRVKIYQTNTDIFYPQIHPPTLWKFLKYFVFG